MKEEDTEKNLQYLIIKKSAADDAALFAVLRTDCADSVADVSKVGGVEAAVVLNLEDGEHLTAVGECPADGEGTGPVIAHRTDEFGGLTRAVA